MLVGAAGLEPASLSAGDFKSPAYANSATLPSAWKTVAHAAGMAGLRPRNAHDVQRPAAGHSPWENPLARIARDKGVARPEGTPRRRCTRPPGEAPSHARIAQLALPEVRDETPIVSENPHVRSWENDAQPSRCPLSKTTFSSHFRKCAVASRWERARRQERSACRRAGRTASRTHWPRMRQSRQAP